MPNMPGQVISDSIYIANYI